MKKIFTLFCMMLLAVQFAAAQKTLYVVSTEGKLTAYSAQKVAFDNDLFTFTYGGVTEITKESFSASFNVTFKSTDCKSFSQSPEVGICFSDVNEMPTIADGKIKKGSSLSKYTFSISSLDAGTTYYYRAYVKVNDAVYYGDVCSETTYGKKPTNYKVINGHKFVDLGLPSGLFWATGNVGAVTAADDGNYFAWGETEPQSSNTYDWSSYRYGTSDDNQTKYNSTDKKTVLEKEDDAAYVNWGDSCRMPTYDEFGELLNSSNCTWTWTSMTTSSGYSINGYKVTSVTNGNSVFLPATSSCFNGHLDYHGTFGNYWSSTLSSYSSYGACGLGFSSNTHDDVIGVYRYTGQTVRPVAEP